MAALISRPPDRARRRLLAGWAAVPLGLFAGRAAATAPIGRFDRLYGANPVVTYLLAALYPERLVGWNFPPPAQAQGFIRETALNRPVVGGFFGQGRMPNEEALLAEHPDLAVVSGATSASLERSTEAMESLGLLTLTLNLDRVDDYPAAIRRLGAHLGESARSGRAAEAAEHLLGRIRALPDHGGPTIFYAEQHDGLATECRGSLHSEAIRLVHAVNPHTCGPEEAGSRFGMVRIHAETLLDHDPDWILTQSADLYRRFHQAPAFSMLSAVRGGRVLLAPQAPFRWLDRPPSFMRLPGALWLYDRLHPGHGRFDLDAELRRFFAAFFRVELTPEQLSAMRYPEEAI
jgi:iron complex transport system substrate-binding protein